MTSIWEISAQATAANSCLYSAGTRHVLSALVLAADMEEAVERFRDSAQMLGWAEITIEWYVEQPDLDFRNRLVRKVARNMQKSGCCILGPANFPYYYLDGRTVIRPVAWRILAGLVGLAILIALILLILFDPFEIIASENKVILLLAMMFHVTYFSVKLVSKKASHGLPFLKSRRGDH